MKGSRLSLNRFLVLAMVVLVILVSIETAAKYQVDFAVPRSPPSEPGLSELLWVREHFGYDNLHIIIVVRDTSSYLWALAYNGGLIYFGNLFYLLTNRTDYSLLNSKDDQVRSDYVGSIQKLWVYGALQEIWSGKYLVLVPYDIYQPNVLEMQALTLLGGSVFSAKPMNNNRVQQLFLAWNQARSSNDLLGAAAPYITISPMADCSTFSSWTSTSSYESVSVAPNFTNVSPCSIRVTTKTIQGPTLYVTLTSNTWNLANESYIGFYFRGTTTSPGDYSFTVVLSSTPEYTSYYHYTLTDKGLWDGGVHGLVLQLSQFQVTGTPAWSSILSVDFGVYTGQRGSFDYSLQYVVTAHDF